MRNPTAFAVGTGRRALLAGFGGLGLAAALPHQAQAAAAASDQAEWLEFRQRFITAEGRVVDTGNQGISHSEGQGYGLLLAEAFADRPTFESILGWTRRTLLRPDGLHSWRFRPGSIGADDPNNATDGDLYLSWGLLRAAERWNNPEFGRMALEIGQAISRRLVLEVQGRTLLLPGGQGFAEGNRILVNPSYYAFPALQALGQASQDPVWNKVVADGVKLLREARFGRWGLPADWVELSRGETSAPTLAQGRPTRFSYDAVRVPLHLAWAGLTEEPALDAANRFWAETSASAPPAWTDLRTGQLGMELASTGVVAIARLAKESPRGRANMLALPKVNQSRDYYAAALTLLARVAAQEAPPPGVAPVLARRGHGAPLVVSAEKPLLAVKQEAVSFGRSLVRRAAAFIGWV